MTITPAAAAQAYSALGGATGAGQNAARPAGAEGGFGDMLRQAVGSVVEQGRGAEAQSVALGDGKANLVDVVTAVAETEVAFETMVTLRDRVVSAYEEIMRMPI